MTSSITDHLFCINYSLLASLLATYTTGYSGAAIEPTFPSEATMKKQFALLAVLVPCLITVALLTTLFARDTAPSDWKALETRYAQANLELASARLAMAEHENQTQAESVPIETLDSLQAGVRLAQERLRQLEAGDDANNPFGPKIAAAEVALNGLEENHSESLEANKLQAGAVPVLALRREQAEIDVAKARLAALKSLSQQPVEVQVQWEIQQLQDEVRALWARPLIED